MNDEIDANLESTAEELREGVIRQLNDDPLSTFEGVGEVGYVTGIDPSFTIETTTGRYRVTVSVDED